MRRASLLAALVAVLTTATAAPSLAGGAPPIVGAYTETGVDVMAADGTVVHSFPAFQFFSLDGNVLAGSRHTRTSEAVFVSDATTGERLFRIDQAFAPIVLANGSRIGFMPDRFAKRDPYFNSVWLRNAAGRERAVVRFAGPRSTVGPTGFHGEGVPLDNAWSANGDTLAVTYGNDADLFIYDVWVVDTKTREARRITRGQESRFPSLSPSGDRLAYVHEIEFCGGPAPGYRPGDLVTVDGDGTDRAVLLSGSCDGWYTDPRWLSEDELAAARLTRVGPDDYDVDIVRIDAATGTVTEVTTVGDAFFFSVSAELGLLAYQRGTVADGFEMIDLADGTTTSFANGVIPHLSGAHRLI